MAKLDKETYYSVAVEIYDFWLANRFSPAQSAAMVAVADKVCGLDHSKGLFGIDQDHADVVCNGNLQYPGCGIKLDENTKLSSVLEATWWDLRKMEKEALDEILASVSAFDAGIAAAMFYGKLAQGTAEAIGTEAEAWLQYFVDNSNTAVANNTANTAGSNTTVFSPSANEEVDHPKTKEDFKKNSRFKDFDFKNTWTGKTSNTDTADNTNHNISNVNWFDPDLKKKPDQTTYLDTPTTSNTMWLDRSLTPESKEVKKVWVDTPNTVTTATSVISEKTVKNYANVDVANTIPKNSNRTRLEGEPDQEDFTTNWSHKTPEANTADNVAQGIEGDPKEEKKENPKKVTGDTKEKAKKEVGNTAPAANTSLNTVTLADKAKEENKQDDTKGREYYNKEDTSSSSNTVPEQSSNNVTS